MTDSIRIHFDGTIRDMRVFDRQLTGEQIFGNAPRADHAYCAGAAQSYDFARMAGGIVTVSNRSGSVELSAATDFIAFSNLTLRKMDIQFGAGRKDSLTGSDARTRCWARSATTD